MRAISRHRDLRGSKMRFLVVSALFACASAAPSLIVGVAGVPAVPVAYSAAVPTLSPGDVQAAFIDAQVKAQDLAIAAADKRRELSEQASEDLKDKIVVGSDLVKENTDETFWAVQDKQWQALDALKTAEANLDGAIASSAPVLAKSAVVGPYVAAVAPISPISPIVYTAGITPVLKSAIEPVKAVESNPAEVKPVEEAKTEEKNEAWTKTAEGQRESDAVAVEASTKNLEAKPQLGPIIAPIAIQPFGYPIVAPVALSPVLKYGAIPQVGLAPTIVKTGW